MKKSIWIFLLAVLLPSLVLGWLALRSAEEQQIILERRTAELYQKETDALAAAARSLVDEERRNFAEAVRKLLAAEVAEAVAQAFPERLASAWPRKAVGFALGRAGNLISPSPQSSRTHPEWQKFLINNGAFLSSTAAAQVYWVSAEELNRPDQLRKLRGNNEYSNGAKLGSEQFGNSLAGILKKSPAEAPLADAANHGTNGLRDAASPMPALSAASADKVETSQYSLSQEAVQAARQHPFLSPPHLESSTAAGADRSKDAAPGGRAAPIDNSTSLRKEAAAASQQQAPLPQHFSRNDAQPVAGVVADREPADSKSALQVQTNPVANLAMEKQEAVLRNVAPQRLPEDNGRPVSQLAPATAEFNALTADSNEGVVTRFVQDHLEIIFWIRPPQAADFIFGCLVEAENLRDLWPGALPPMPEASVARGVPEFVLALLDDRARPVATRPSGEHRRDWKQPFVAAEIGEALPHWEATLYLQRPEQLEESARSIRRTLKLLIAAALGAICCGGWVVVADARRQLALAQQKTDFVSNVSHELKTPLTSIRMFAELMQNDRNASNPKHPQYLRIIMVEAERLTRLINNVLDFAGLERKQKHLEKRPLDLLAVIERTWEGLELHLSEQGFTTSWKAAPGPYPVSGDADALAQILVNLLSNAEKYSGERKEVELHTYLDGSDVCVSVLDRGCGVPPGEERKIFASFYRAHDSLSSGVQGSGLGLTLAQRFAAEHSASITYQARAGGGSNFTLRIPLTSESAQT